MPGKRAAHAPEGGAMGRFLIIAGIVLLLLGLAGRSSPSWD